MGAVQDVQCDRKWRAHGEHRWNAFETTWRCEGTWHRGQLRHMLWRVRNWRRLHRLT